MNEEAGKELLAKIRTHMDTKVVDKLALEPVFRFVSGRYPRIAEVLPGVVIYRNENTAFCRRLGLSPSAAGVFLVQARCILLCYQKDPVPDDVVVIHELLHYGARLMGARFVNEEQEEDFAFFNSIPYLVSVGYKEDWIIKEYMSPYYRMRMMRELHADQKSRPTDAEVTDRCRRMVDAAMERSSEPTSDDDDEDRFNDI